MSWKVAFPLAVAASLLVTACTGTMPLSPSSRSEDPLAASNPAPSFAQFADIPIPDEASMDLDRTLILGSNDAWIGRLVVRTPNEAGKVYDFYLQEMPKFGWQLLTVVRAAQSLQTYRRGERVATVQITPNTVNGAVINLTVSPQGLPLSP